MTAPYDADRLAAALQVLAEHPLSSGDAALLLDSDTCVELEGLAEDWSEQVCAAVVRVLTEHRVREAALAIARPGAALSLGDYRIWRELHAQLRDTQVRLLPLKALPSAA